MQAGARLFEKLGGVGVEIVLDTQEREVGPESGNDAGLGALGDAYVVEVADELPEGVDGDVAQAYATRREPRVELADVASIGGTCVFRHAFLDRQIGVVVVKNPFYVQNIAHRDRLAVQKSISKDWRGSARLPTITADRPLVKVMTWSIFSMRAGRSGDAASRRMRVEFSDEMTRRTAVRVSGVSAGRQRSRRWAVAGRCSASSGVIGVRRESAISMTRRSASGRSGGRMSVCGARSQTIRKSRFSRRRRLRSLDRAWICGVA